MDERIMQSLMALGLHYPKPKRTPEEHARWMADYVVDLDCCKPEQVEAACTAWRRSKAIRFPKVGELLEIALAVHTGPKRPEARPWTPCSDVEFLSLSVGEQIRELTILADKAEMAAGPQKYAPDRMPAKWQRLRAVAKQYRDEISRLRKTLYDRGATSVVRAYDVKEDAFL